MRHRKRTRRLGRTTPHRQAMMRNMVASLFQHGRIITTDTRAKELRRLADRMVTLAKDGSLHARRQALTVIRDRDIVAKLFEELKQKFVSRNGGYTRIIKIGPRRGDAALMSYVELVTESLERPKKKKKGKAAEVAAAAAGVIPQAKTASEEEPAETKEEVPSEAGQPAEAETEKVGESEPETSSEEESAAAEEASESSDESVETEDSVQEEEQDQPEQRETPKDDDNTQ